jgi:uncharacterized membrane protein
MGYAQRRAYFPRRYETRLYDRIRGYVPRYFAKIQEKEGKNMKTTRTLVRVAIIAALYAGLTLVLAPISYAAIQVRVSEALTILPLFCWEAVPGLAIGCFLANIPMGIWDMLIGTLATLLAAICTRLVKKIWFGVIPPVIFNAFLVPIIFLTIPGMDSPYMLNVLTVGLGELIAVTGAGIPLYFALKRTQTRFPALFENVNDKKR